MAGVMCKEVAHPKVLQGPSTGSIGLRIGHTRPHRLKRCPIGSALCLRETPLLLVHFARDYGAGQVTPIAVRHHGELNKHKIAAFDKPSGGRGEIPCPAGAPAGDHLGFAARMHYTLIANTLPEDGGLDSGRDLRFAPAWNSFLEESCQTKVRNFIRHTHPRDFAIRLDPAQLDQLGAEIDPFSTASFLPVGECCVNACPFTPSRALWNFEKKHAMKCDLCANTPYWNKQGGPGGAQVCVETCPMKAISYTGELPVQSDKGYVVDLRNSHWAMLGYPTD
jgi:ferredoxin